MNFNFCFIFGLPLFRAGSHLCFDEFSLKQFLLFLFFCEQFGALHAHNLRSTFDLLTLFIDDFSENLVEVAMLVNFYTCEFDYVSHFARLDRKYDFTP